MKRIKSMRFFLPMLLLSCSLFITSCSDDDDQHPNEVTTETMFGNYTGKMIANSIVPNSDDTSMGTDVTARINKDTVYFDKFPIHDIVLSIVQDETLADNIVKAVGDVKYKVEYTPTLTTAKDSIHLELHPEPLKLSVVIPSNVEGQEPQTMLVEVKIVAGEGDGYDVAKANLNFKIAATEVLIGEGEGQMPLPNFNPTTFGFNMNQDNVALLHQQK